MSNRRPPPSRLVLLCLLVAVGSFTGCTSIEMKRLTADLNPTQVCIRENPKVLVTDFLDVLQAGFDRHGIVSKIVPADAPAGCEYTVTYTALRSWDISTYLSHAEIRIEKDGHEVAHAIYHLRVKGRVMLTKWEDTPTKMDPIIDDLLKFQHRGWIKRGL